MAIEVKLNAFEGPLDLLLHLIDKNKIDIYDIPIVEITEQYMEYIRAMEREDLGVMSEFMVMAATLLDIKCRMLLPKEENEEGEEEDPREELVQKLLEYKMYKYMSYELKDRLDAGGKVWYRKESLPDEVRKFEIKVEPEELLEGVTLDRMKEIFRSVLKRQEDRIDPIRSKFGRIEKEEISMSQKVVWLREYAKEHRSFSFRSLLTSQSSRTQVVVTFLVILELMKMGYVNVEQERLFSEIQVKTVVDPADWKELDEEELL